ncbi:MAG: hypothetical protein LBJ67_14415 [Planctomycetaceae bacterium]|jgi:hypothetical protein|nr:hypothetical protein [Planctomycetaceae bacterium]
MRTKIYIILLLLFAGSAAIHSQTKQQEVYRLVQGLSDEDNGVIGQRVGELKMFAVADFDAASQAEIVRLLKRPNYPHYNDIALLAGYIGVGKAELMQHYQNPGLPVRQKWNIVLALARMGEKAPLEYCLSKIKKAPVNSYAINYLFPDLIYTRQKAAIDYCVEWLHSDEKLCQSPNPDYSASIPCAYAILELLAPVIEAFPVPVDPVIGLETGDYEKTLQEVRKWFKAHPNYQIKTDTL